MEVFIEALFCESESVQQELKTEPGRPRLSSMRSRHRPCLSVKIRAHPRGPRQLGNTRWREARPLSTMCPAEWPVRSCRHKNARGYGPLLWTQWLLCGAHSVLPGFSPGSLSLHIPSQLPAQQEKASVITLSHVGSFSECRGGENPCSPLPFPTQENHWATLGGCF